jgi:hypothetical protein
VEFLGVAIDEERRDKRIVHTNFAGTGRRNSVGGEADTVDNFIQICKLCLLFLMRGESGRRG